MFYNIIEVNGFYYYFYNTTMVERKMRKFLIKSNHGYFNKLTEKREVFLKNYPVQRYLLYVIIIIIIIVVIYYCTLFMGRAQQVRERTDCRASSDLWRPQIALVYDRLASV